MKKLVIFYSYTGHVKSLVQTFAKKETADIMEIKDVHRPSTLKAYTIGCFASMRGKSWPIEPLKADLKEYDRIILFSPVWANNPPPVVNALLDELPGGKAVAVKMVSASGKSGCKDRIAAVLKNKGCTLESYEDLKN